MLKQEEHIEIDCDVRFERNNLILDQLESLTNETLEIEIVLIDE